MSQGRKVEDTDLVIKFPSKESAEHFALWLCESGEQQYWDWMETAEEDWPGDITATSFHYHGEEDETKELTDPARYKEFMCDNTIRTTMGRLSNEQEG
jgi:hypothetical protein